MHIMPLKAPLSKLAKQQKLSLTIETNKEMRSRTESGRLGCKDRRPWESDRRNQTLS